MTIERTDYRLECGEVFFGEVSVERRHTPVPKDHGWMDDEYDHDNPDGAEYGRRNYGESCYASGMGDLSPAEYPFKVGRYFGSFSAGSPSDQGHPGDHPPGN